MEWDVGTLHAVGNQPKTATRVGRLGIGQGGTGVPFCSGRPLGSSTATCFLPARVVSFE